MNITCQCIDCVHGRTPAKGVTSDLALPRDVVHVERVQLEDPDGPGYLYDDRGRRVFMDKFVWHYDGFHETVTVPFYEGMSQAQMEDMIGAGMERFVSNVIIKKQELSGKHAPSKAEKKEISEVLRDIRAYHRRKAEGRGRLIMVGA